MHHTQKQCVSKAAFQHCSFQHIQFYNSEISFKSYILCAVDASSLVAESHVAMHSSVSNQLCSYSSRGEHLYMWEKKIMCAGWDGNLSLPRAPYPLLCVLSLRQTSLQWSTAIWHTLLGLYILYSISPPLQSRHLKWSF